MECLNIKGEEPGKRSLDQIATGTGMPINVILEVIGGLL